MSALAPEADMLIVGINVCYLPKADIRQYQSRYAVSGAPNVVQPAVAER